MTVHNSIPIILRRNPSGNWVISILYRIFFLHFSSAIDVIRSNTKENFLWEPEKINVKFHMN